jgi:hypothetical protein
METALAHKLGGTSSHCLFVRTSIEDRFSGNQRRGLTAKYPLRDGSQQTRLRIGLPPHPGSKPPAPTRKPNEAVSPAVLRSGEVSGILAVVRLGDEGPRKIIGVLSREYLLHFELHLGNLEFEHCPKDALRHYEIGMRIGELSLGADFDGILL